jgi:ribosome biogenesis GTPase
VKIAVVKKAALFTVFLCPFGELSHERWAHYNNLKREAKFTEDKSSFQREKSARNKSLAMQSKNNKKNGGTKK